MNGADLIPLEQAQRPKPRDRKRPTVQGSMDAFGAQFFTATELLQDPPPQRQWLVRDLIPFRGVTLFSAHGGDGKSLLALQLAVCAQLGRPWIGRETAHARAAVISCEDDREEMHRRLWDIVGADGIEPAALAGLELRDSVGTDTLITRWNRQDQQWEDAPFAISLMNWAVQAEVRLLVLDSLYNFFSGNQLDMVAVQRFMATLATIAREIDGAVLGLWHPSQAGRSSGDGTSGSNAFHNAARGRLYMDRERDGEGNDTGIRIIKSLKQNYAPDGDAIRCRWENGRFVPVGEQAASGGFVESIERRSRDDRACEVFLACLDDATRQGRNVSGNKGPNWAPKLFAGMPRAKADGFKANDLAKAMETLFDRGAVTVGQVGLYSNRTPRMGLKRAEPSSPVQGDLLNGGDR